MTGQITVRLSRDVISVFTRGGKILTDLLGGGGAKYERNKILCAKTQKITIFLIQGANASPPCPPNDVLASNQQLLSREDVPLCVTYAHQCNHILRAHCGVCTPHACFERSSNSLSLTW